MAPALCSPSWAQAGLPDAPSPQTSAALVAAFPSAEANPVPDPAAGGQQTFPPTPASHRGSFVLGLEPNYVPVPRSCQTNACTQERPELACCQKNAIPFASYLKDNAALTYTPRYLARLAFRGVIDPFNLLTIGGTSAISVASDSHSPYGPGMMGWAKQSGVTLTEDLTSEFVGTFLIPSIDHQDPHYYRMPNASLVRRIAHCMYQPFWTVSVTGHGMVNYSNVAGAVVEEAVDASYVPYQEVGWGAAAARIGTNYATMPIGNFVTEFVPDFARHVNVHAVFLQRIIDRVAIEEAGGPGTAP